VLIIKKEDEVTGKTLLMNGSDVVTKQTRCVWDICTPTLLAHSRMGSLQRSRGYTYTCRLRDGTLHLVTPVWGRAPLYSGIVFGMITPPLIVNPSDPYM
jgi:hypothetical protein